MTLRPNRYSTFIFDCDGVILNSNVVKTEAFRTATNQFGDAAADAMVAYHVKNGGVSRFTKFEYFVTRILPELNIPSDPSLIQPLIQYYSEAIADALLSCEIADGLDSLRAAAKNVRWLVVSGGAQEELRRVFVKRRIADLFDGGIFGSPDSKDEILHREVQSGNIIGNALFLGDSCYDVHAAKRAGLDAVFLSEWSEVEDWKEFIKRESVPHFRNIREFLKLF